MATEVTATDVRRKFASVLKAAVAGERTIITRHGKVLAAVVSAADFEKLTASLSPQASETIKNLVTALESGEYNKPTP